MSPHELIPTLAGFLAAALAVLRLTVSQSKAFTERLLAFFEHSLTRQDESIDCLSAAVTELNQGVRENTLLVRQVAEWLQVSTPVGRA